MKFELDTEFVRKKKSPLKWIVAFLIFVAVMGYKQHSGGYEGWWRFLIFVAICSVIAFSWYRAATRSIGLISSLTVNDEEIRYFYSQGDGSIKISSIAAMVKRIGKGGVASILLKIEGSHTTKIEGFRNMTALAEEIESKIAASNVTTQKLFLHL